MARKSREVRHLMQHQHECEYLYTSSDSDRESTGSRDADKNLKLSSNCISIFSKFLQLCVFKNEKVSTVHGHKQ